MKRIFGQILVTRRWLMFIAGSVWTGAGLLLLQRAISWVSEFTLPAALLFQAVGVVLAIFAYRFGFSKIVERNLRRLRTLPEKASPFAFSGARGYLMIATMILIGMILRNSSLPKHYLSIPYASMGGVLLIGSVAFFRSFRETESG